VGARSVRLLRSGLAADGAYLGVRYGVDDGGEGRLPTVQSQCLAGTVSAERADLDDGEAAATVRMRRPGVVVLSASYDPGWTATVNGRPRPTRMVAPALTAVDVPAGTDHVVFRFHGYGDYPELLARAASLSPWPPSRRCAYGGWHGDMRNDEMAAKRHD
jgi:Bacterial membrane protein YfhO